MPICVAASINFQRPGFLELIIASRALRRLATTGDCPAPRKDSVSEIRTKHGHSRSYQQRKILRPSPVRKLKRPWTEEEGQRLLAMAAQKRSRRMIAASLRRTEGSMHPAFRSQELWLLRVIAAALNARGVATARGGQWHAKSVSNILERA